MKKYLLIILAASLIALWPFFNKGYFMSHDGEWMVIRFTAFHQTLKSGQFPVRYVDRLYGNYGYPVLNFLYPLPFYTSEIWKIIGFSFVDSVKVTFVASAVASVFFMFWALSQEFEPIASLAGSIVYIWVPYRFVDLYVRGSIGENMAFVFLPLILGSFFKINKDKEIFWPVLSASIAGLILSHNIIAFIFLPIFFVYALLSLKKDVLKVISFFFLGTLAAAFFWFPAIYDLRYVQFTSTNVSDTFSHLVSLSKLLVPKWGYGPNPNGSDPLPVQLGIVTIGVFLAALIKMFAQKKKSLYLIYFLIITIACIFLMTTWSRFFWHNVIISKLIQFPWRLNSVVAFTSPIFAAYLLHKQKNSTVLFMILVTAAVLSTIFYTKPASFTQKPDSYYSTNEGSTTVQDEYLPIWVKQKPNVRANQKMEITKGNAKLTSETIKASNYKAVIEAQSTAQITINAFFFPGWVAKLDGKNVPIGINKNGTISFSVPNGMHSINVLYRENALHLFADLAALFSALSLFIISVHFLKQRDYEI